jgi:hypothetical protein
MTKTQKWLFWILILAGVAMRVLGALWFAEVRTADNGIICLMTKHALDGKGMPVFFYGLPYMGSIEPLMSVLFCKLFGLSGFMVNMGTAIMGILLLPVVYLWGRDAGGRGAGLAALAFCVVGPEFYFQFESWADGGYAAIVLFSALLIWFATRCLEVFKEKGTLTPGRVALLALLVGVGWWQSPLMISAYLTVGLMYVFVLRARLLTPTVLVGIPAFLIGSAPWWVWNIRNEWRSFDMLDSSGNPGLVRGLKIFFSDRILRLLDVWDHPEPLQIAIVVCVVVCMACAGAVYWSRPNGARKGWRSHLTGAVIFLAISALLFTRSKLALAPAVRYLLPLVPPLAVLMAAGAGWLSKRLPLGVGWIGILLLVVLQCATVPKRLGEQETFSAFKAEAEAVGELLLEQGIEHIYSPYQVHFANHGLNFMLNEKIVFTDFTRERYGPYAVQMECADSAAVLNNHGNLSSFLQAVSGRSKTVASKRIHVQHDICPIETSPVRLPNDMLAAIVDGHDNDALAALTDSQLLTGLSSQHGGSVTLTATLAEPQRLTALRLVPNTMFGLWRIEVQDAASGAWVEVLPETAVTGYFLSGRRLYYGSGHYRMQARFAPVLASGIRISLRAAHQQIPAAISELALFKAGESEADETHDIGPLLQALKEHNVDAVYADRWESAKIEGSFGADVRTLQSVHEPFSRAVWLERDVVLTPGTAFVVRRDDAPLLDAVLRQRDLVMQADVLGPWVLFRFGLDGWHEDLRGSHGLYWVGFGALLKPSADRAAVLHAQARELRESGDTAGAVSRLEKALDWCCDYQPIWQELAECYRLQGQASEAGLYEMRYAEACQPAVATPVTFKNVAKLLGVTVGSAAVSPGQSVDVTYYWNYVGESLPSTWAVFVHFRRENEICFQGDHVLLPGMVSEVLPYERVYRQCVTVHVPKDTEPGDYAIWLGLYARAAHGRVKPITELRSQRRAVCMTPALHVVDAANGVVNDE